MGGRGGTSGRSSDLDTISNESGVKNYIGNQTFYKEKPNGSYEKQKGSTFMMNGREFGIHKVSGYTAGKYMITDTKTGMALGLSQTTKEAASLARKSVKKIKSDSRIAEYENKLRKYKS